jgi:hypothetical protein
MLFTNDGGATCTIREASRTQWNVIEQSKTFRCSQTVMEPRTAHNRIDGLGLVSLGNASRDVDVVPVPVCHTEESEKRV